MPIRKIEDTWPKSPYNEQTARCAKHNAPLYIDEENHHIFCKECDKEAKAKKKLDRLKEQQDGPKLK